MSLRTSLNKLIRRDPAASLRERAAELRASIPTPLSPAAAAAPAFADQVAQAGPNHDVLAGGGIDHRDGTVSYADATGKVVRRPLARWINFNAQQMHNRVQHEMGRRRVLEANPLPADEYAAWEAKIRRELRSDAVHALAFRHDRAFEAAQAIRTGIEPATPALRERGDAELLALAPLWEAACDAYALTIQQQDTVIEAANADNRPGPAPAGSGSDWQAWFEHSREWRERTGVEAAEEASGEACRALGAIEDRIAELPAASLAGLRLKARVAQRNEDIDIEWPDKLSEGLTRDLLAFTEVQAAAKPAISISLVDQIDFASASLEDLRDIQNIAEHVGAVAYAYAWGPRCRQGTNAYGASIFNDLGKLVMWLGDALTDVESAVDKEVARRVPDNSTDRETRLSMRAVTTIDNGDPEAIEAFAHELLAHAEAERQGR